jgi:hypothetical protein
MSNLGFSAFYLWNLAEKFLFLESRFESPDLGFTVLAS